MNKTLIILCFFAAALLDVAQSLKAEDYQEGSCLQVKPQRNFNATWWNSINLPYISAGSRYHLSRIATGYPGFTDMREFEFYYKACLLSYINVTAGVALASGFDAGVIGNFEVRRTSQRGVFDFSPAAGPGDNPRHTVTLTDNRSFAVFTNCWLGSNQRGWDVVSLTPTLDSKTKKND